MGSLHFLVSKSKNFLSDLKYDCFKENMKNNTCKLLISLDWILIYDIDKQQNFHFLKNMRFITSVLFLFLVFPTFGHSIAHAIEEELQAMSGHNLEAIEKLSQEKLPIIVDVGLYIMSVDSFDYTNSTFSVTYWVWFVYDKEYCNIINPHETCEVINFITKEDIVSFKEIKAGKVWSGKKIRGTFKYSWDLSKYPIDEQFLELRLDESDRESDVIQYRADHDNSGYMESETKIPGWSIKDFRIRQDNISHSSTYGDPSSVAKKGSVYTAIVATLNLKRDTLSTFFKLHTVLFVAFFISWLSSSINFSKNPPYLAARVATLVSMIYAVVLNIQYVDNIMGRVPTITLTDKFQFATLFMIFLFFLHLVISYKIQIMGKYELSNQIDKYVIILSPFVYVISLLLISVGII